MSNWQQLDGVWQRVMTAALDAYVNNCIPIGAAVVDEHGGVVAVGRNRFSQDRIAHAETEALRLVPASVNRKTAALYTSMEPCPMCTGAIRIMQLKNLHMAARDPAAGSTGLLQASSFMRRFECRVAGPADPVLEFVNVVLMLEHRTRTGHQRWRQEWFDYLPGAVATGEQLAAEAAFAGWLETGSSSAQIYDSIAARYAAGI